MSLARTTRTLRFWVAAARALGIAIARCPITSRRLAGTAARLALYFSSSRRVTRSGVLGSGSSDGASERTGVGVGFSPPDPSFRMAAPRTLEALL